MNNLLIPGSIAHICYTFANNCYQYLNKEKEGFQNDEKIDTSVLIILIILSILIFCILVYSLLFIPLKYNRKNNKNNIGIIILLILGFLFFPLINILVFAIMVEKNM
jgi:heme/copper-type cytochrome/quinol oxidase subunit 2